jgi:hypothetical protein
MNLMELVLLFVVLVAVPALAPLLGTDTRRVELLKRR